LGEDVRVYLFGSVVGNRLTVDIDIDIAVVMDNPPRKVSEIARIKAKILEILGKGYSMVVSTCYTHY